MWGQKQSHCETYEGKTVIKILRKGVGKRRPKRKRMKGVKPQPQVELWNLELNDICVWVKKPRPKYMYR